MNFTLAISHLMLFLCRLEDVAEMREVTEEQAQVFEEKNLTNNNTIEEEHDTVTKKPFIPSKSSFNCSVNVPCVYPERVDLRIIVMTQNRHESLLKVLHSLQALELDGAVAALEIWIDPIDSNQVHTQTLLTAMKFNWSKGMKRVHIQRERVGIRGQWINTWRPKGDGELALFLEDDVTVSAYAWRWTKAAHEKFQHSEDILGYSLANQYMYCVGKKKFTEPKHENIYLNRQMGSWGFIPVPKVWAAFQDWYQLSTRDESYQPLLGRGDRICYDSWYRMYTYTMWTIWFAKYAYMNKLFCVYSNLAPFAGVNYRLAIHRRENGLHFKNKVVNKERELLQQWNEDFVNFPNIISTYEFDGTHKYITI